MFKSRKMKEAILAYKRTFDSPDGKIVLHDLMNSCHMLTSTLETTPQETAFNEGARSVVVRILKTCNTDMETLNRMIEQMEKPEEQV